jgi:hypothetical protein
MKICETPNCGRDAVAGLPDPAPGELVPDSQRGSTQATKAPKYVLVCKDHARAWLINLGVKYLLPVDDRSTEWLRSELNS